ncbi:hypothetical protein LEP1GSC061_0113 [Leptospira wolffii serovar Khorat str. Khorat-H2]|nr:hypothetical protein LEP1GSC061_0113 [Leptospira wolffii serovar Khorat str. Khorat-H2]
MISGSSNLKDPNAITIFYSSLTVFSPNKGRDCIRSIFGK